MKIFLDEEYGYRAWLWSYPRDEASLIADFNVGRAPLNFYNPSHSEFDGELTIMSAKALTKLRRSGVLSNPLTEQFWLHFDAYMHVHDLDDSYLRLASGVYPARVVDFERKS